MLLLLAACTSPPATPSDTGTVPDAGGDGIYTACEPDDPACLDQLDVLAGAGLSLVIDYNQAYAPLADQLAYLDRAAQLGMKVVWSMHQSVWWDGTPYTHEFGSLFADCAGCATNGERLEWLVGALKDHPALWGWYVVDEIPAAQHDAVITFTDLLRELDPDHPRLVVHYEDPATHLAAYADAGDLLAFDWYPIGEYCDGAKEVGTVAGQAAATAQVAAAAGKDAGFVLQAFSWEQYPYDPPCERWPTAAEMQGMREALVGTGMSQVFWYSYSDILASDDPAGHWADLVAALP